MSKYKPLSAFLGAHAPDEWRVAFDQLEEALGFPLPKTARMKAGWWSNDEAAPKPHARAWLDAGWRADADLTAGEVVFRRGAQRLDPAPDPTAHDVMAAADAAFAKGKAVATARKVGLAAAVVGVFVAGLGVAAARLIGRRR